MLNESTAKELFGDGDPINQFVKFDNKSELKVTGIFKDVPDNSGFWFHALVPIIYDPGWLPKDKNKWDEFYPRIYAEVEDESSIDDINLAIKDVVKNHVNNGSNPELFLHAMSRWHLYNEFVNGKEAGGKIEYVRMFTGIAVLILLIACINYMNLATARSERRAKEVGIRKSIGSRRSELVQQFLLESFFITTLAFVMGVVLVEVCLPWYNNLVHAPFSLTSVQQIFGYCPLASSRLPACCQVAIPHFIFHRFNPLRY